eukprot:351314-Chlamydomonas_euryale.AAC.5
MSSMCACSSHTDMTDGISRQALPPCWIKRVISTMWSCPLTPGVRRGRGFAWQYLAQWEGYGEEHTSWEPEDNVKGCIAYQEFWDNRSSGTTDQGLKVANKLQAAK